MRLVQLVPPGEGGVLDYARCLQSAWERQGQASELIALSEALVRERRLAQRLSDPPATPDPAPATGCTVLLHFSGYGYSPRGVCTWLVDELKKLRLSGAGQVRLVVVFHELFAWGPPWQSAFWLSPLQASIARRLARMADAIWTNTDRHAIWLRSAVPAPTPIHVRPVFSNVGEPAAPPAASCRTATAVVFGLPVTRQRAFDGLRRHEDLLLALGIEQLLEVGRGEASAAGFRAIECRRLGPLDHADLGRLLQSSRFGMVPHPPHDLAKSGVFAAYAAHGCVVLETCESGPDSDGLVSGGNYMNLPMLAARGGGLPTVDQQESIATRLRRWYGGHRIAGQSQELLAVARG